MTVKCRSLFPVLPPERKTGKAYVQWLEGQLKVHELIYAALPQGIVVMLPDGTTTSLNTSAERLLGIKNEHSFGRNLLDSFRGADRLSCDKRILECARSGAGYRCDKGYVRHETDGIIPVELDVAALRNEHSEIVRIIVTFRDLRPDLAHQAELERMALTDQLTGCKNRWWFEPFFETALQRAQADYAWLGLVFVDLDNFKTINDENYEVGDDIIHRSAQALSSVLRATDSLVRLGGDEFVFLAQGLDKNTVLEIVGRMVAALSQVKYSLQKQPGQAFHVTASIGVAVLKGDDPRINSIKTYAQEAKGLAKRQGKDCIIVMPQDHEERPSVH